MGGRRLRAGGAVGPDDGRGRGRPRGDGGDCSAAARLGAALAHDWACVSLSDLLTPWEVIVRRVEAAARPTSSWRSTTRRAGPATGSSPRSPRSSSATATRARPSGWSRTPTGPASGSRSSALDDLAGSRRHDVHDGHRRQLPDVRDARAGWSRPGSTRPRPGRPDERADPPSERRRASGSWPSRWRSSTAELGPEPADPAERAVVRRMVHASADFDFAAERPVRPRGDRRGGRGVPGGAPGRDRRRDAPGRASAATWPGRSASRPLCGLDDREADRLAEREGLTRSAAGLRRAASRVGDGAVVAIGNAPDGAGGGGPAGRVRGLAAGLRRRDPGRVRRRRGGEAAARRSRPSVPFITSLGRKGGRP